METTMKLVYKLRESIQFRKLLYVSVIALTLLYVFSVPSFGESTSVARYIIYASMILLGFVSIFYCFLYDNLRIHKYCVLIPIFALFALTGTLMGSNDFRSWISLVLLAGSFFVFLYSFKAIKNKYLVVSIVSLGIFLFSLYFIFHYRNEILNFKSYGSEKFRLGFYFDNPNGVSAYAAVGFATSLFSLLFMSKRNRYLFIIPLFTTTLVGIVTGSRSFIIAVAIFVVVLLYFKFKKHKLVYLIAIGSITILSIILLNLPFMGTMKQRIIDAIETLLGISSKGDVSTISRTLWIDYGFYMGARNMIFGLGVNAFSIYSGVGTYSHSNFAEVICDFGLVGFVLFYLPFVLIFIRAIINKKVDKPLVFSFLIYYFLIGFSNVFYYKKFYFLIMAFVFYLAYVQNENMKSITLVENFNRVIFTCDSMSSGGAEKVISSLANSMASKGISVTIIGVSDIGKQESFYELKNVRYVSLGDGAQKRINSFKRIIKLRRILKNYSPDVVISFLPHINVYTFFALIGTGIPHIVSERNNPYKDPKGTMLRIMKRLAFYFSSGCVFQTNESKEFYPRKVQAQSIVISNPILINFTPNNEHITRNKIVLTVGRLEKQKNYYCALDAFAIFNEENSNLYTLRIYGEGSLRKELEEYCIRKNIEKNVMFLGSDVDWHKKEYMDSMFILASDYEGMPNSLAEAISLRIPCVSTDSPCGGSRELIDDGVNGYLVPVGDSKMLAKKMIQISRQGDFADFNYKEFTRSHSVEIVTEKWINYIKGLKRKIYE